VVSWLCESIHAGVFVPGEQLDVSVDVRNSGGGNAAPVVTVVVYWADPTVGFAHPNFFAATNMVVPPSRDVPGGVQTATISAVIPATAPEHICLLAMVSHPQDPAGVVCDPIQDRHWAQRNLVAAQLAKGAPIILPLTVANPRADKSEFLLTVAPPAPALTGRVAAEVAAVPSQLRPSVRLLDEKGKALSDAGEFAQIRVALDGLARRPLQLLVEMDKDLEIGTAASLEVSIVDFKDKARVGSWGAVLVPPGALVRPAAGSRTVARVYPGPVARQPVHPYD
jgi:hypothetical protein